MSNVKKLQFGDKDAEEKVVTTRKKVFTRTPRPPSASNVDEDDDVEGYTGEESDDETSNQRPPESESDEEADMEILRRSRRIAEKKDGKKEALIIPHGSTYYGVTFTNDDLESVADSRGWITDAVMETWFQYCKHEILGDPRDILLIKPTIAFVWMATKSASDLHDNLLPLSLHTRSLIMIPLTDARHWALLLYHRSSNRFYYYDSMSGHLLKHATSIATRIYPYIQQEQPKVYKDVEIGEAPEIHSQETPQQHDASSCGIYVLAIVTYLCQRLESDNASTTTSSASTDPMCMNALKSSLPHELETDELRVPSKITPQYIARFRREIYQFCIDRYITNPQQPLNGKK